MVFDTISNRSIYAGLGPRIEAALEYLAGLSSAGFSERREELDGTSLFALFQPVTTESAEGRFYEAHRSYIDIQFVLSGNEVIRVSKVTGLEETSPYESDRDIAFYRTTPGTDVRLGPGDFVILYPHDAHLPKLPATPAEAATPTPGPVQKVVVKVRV